MDGMVHEGSININIVLSLLSHPGRHSRDFLIVRNKKNF